MDHKYLKGSWWFANLTCILFGFIESAWKLQRKVGGISITKVNQMPELQESLYHRSSSLEDLEDVILEAYTICEYKMGFISFSVKNV